MKHAFETREIALKSLVLHPDNVRAGSGSGYGGEQIAPLAANIAECGLLQPLLVAPLPEAEGKEVWGVLAGGRRLAALQKLAADKEAKGFTTSMKIACRIVPESEGAPVTLSFSENALQLPMDALDRFEAFAAMRDKDGADVTTIARRFAITERAVKEALRLGSIHPDIRQAHREKRLSLDALKAFNGHPDPVVQLEAFEALTEQTTSMSDWQVRRYFDGRYVRVGDALGQLVYERYKAKGGAISADLIEEDSVLSNRALVDTLLTEILSDAAEARREALGLAWSDYLIQPDWSLTSSYGRVYREPVELEGAAQVQADAMALRMEEIEATFDEEGDGDAQDALQAEYDRLSEALDELTTGYSAINAGIGGVLAIWNGRSIALNEGMVRPEDMPSTTKAQSGGRAAESGSGDEAALPQDIWSDKLRADMGHIRTRAIGLALAQSPELARDYAEFTLIRSILKPYSSYGLGNTIKADAGARGPDEPVDSLKVIEEAFGTLQNQFTLDWVEMEAADSFAAFRGLTVEDRAGLLAFVVAQTLTPCLAGKAVGSIRQLVEAEALPNIRDAWTPDAAFFSRLTKPALMTILKTDLAMPFQADAYEKSKKSELVEYLAGLFAAPFATLTEEQRGRVMSWAPKAMRTFDEDTAADPGSESLRDGLAVSELANAAPEQVDLPQAPVAA